jgi:hypothetical protein
MSRAERRAMVERDDPGAMRYSNPGIVPFGRLSQ